MGITKYIASPMTADQVAALHDELWLALIAIPNHHHRERDARDCNTCMGRKHVQAAYKLLPDYPAEETKS